MEEFESINSIKPENAANRLNFEIQKIKMEIAALEAELERASEFPEDKKEQASLQKRVLIEHEKLNGLIVKQRNLVEMEDYRRNKGGGNA